jgi:glycerophosphoryl diester phosphodiesterase
MHFIHGAYDSQSVAQGNPVAYHYPTRIFAHRGGGTLAPENTLEGMQLAQRMGFEGVEFDVMLTRDEVPVLMHDPIFGRTVFGEGSVAATDAVTLTQMNAGAWAGKAEFAHAVVPRFADVVRYCRANRIFMNVEIKPAPEFEAITGAIVAQTTRALFADEPDRSKWPLLSSFQFRALAAARDTAPECDRAMLYSIVPANWQADLQELQCKALHTDWRRLTEESADVIKAAGYGLFVYTVNDVATAQEMFSMGVDAMCTDRLDLLAPDL